MKLEVYFDSLESMNKFLDENPPDGVSCYMEAGNSIDLEPLFIVFVEFTKDVAAAILATWLHEHTKGKSTKIKYKRKEIIRERIEIIRVIEKHVTTEEETSEPD